MNRLKEFIWYHKYGDGEANGQTLKAFADAAKLTQDERTALAYFYTLTYCIPSAVFLLRNRGRIIAAPVEFALKYKARLLFESDRKYMKMRDCFERSLEFYAHNIHGRPEAVRSIILDARGRAKDDAPSQLEQWYGYGRYASFLFIETYCALMGAPGPDAAPNTIQFEQGKVFTAGLLHVFNRDADANAVDSKQPQFPPHNELVIMMSMLVGEAAKAGADPSFYTIETSLCAYRKLFKGTRYNGYYADRMLGELNKMKQDPLFTSICREVFAARRAALPQRYLGELNGWTGIRPAEKKRYLQTGELYKW